MPGCSTTGCTIATAAARIGANKNAMVVPQRAVAEMQGRKLLAVVGADNKISIRPIETGAVDGDWWVVQGKIKPGEKVVVEGLQKLRPDVVVNPVPYGSTAQQAVVPKS